ncbi:MAG TPA: diadenylate cyclase [Methanoregulaceae archaeon]|nr:diadenylate cyclase [Methanoregulaceae archaeon]
MKVETILSSILIVSLFIFAAIADSQGNQTTITTLNNSSNSSGIAGNVTPSTMNTTGSINNVTVYPTGIVTLNNSTNRTVLINSPPVLLVNPPDTNGLTATVNGIAASGSSATSITALIWDWGDASQPESHNFPFAHSYEVPGHYSINITAFQSDGQDVSRTIGVNVSRTAEIVPTDIVPSFTGSQAPPLPIPVITPSITLFSPAIEHLNVTLNGYSDPGLLNATIRSLTIDWGDGSFDANTSFPASHTYKKEGLYTVNISALRSDGVKTTRTVAFEVNNQETSPAPPVRQEPPQNQMFILIIIVSILAVIIIGGFLQRSIHKRNENFMPDLPKSVAKLAEGYYRAIEKRDFNTAHENATACAHLLRNLAEITPDKRALYLEKAALWDTIAANTGRNVGTREEITKNNKKNPDVPLSTDDYTAICSDTDVLPDVLHAALSLALEIAHEGREGKPVGTSFIIGDTGNVMSHSKQFVLNPFYGHHEAERWITDENMRENIKEFALLDGAFVITGEGLVEAAGRNITVDTSDVRIPKGMGARHASVAGMTLATKSIGVVVSQSGGRISIMKQGEIIRTL